MIFGKALWNSLTIDFQIELINSDEKFKVKEDHDKVLLWAVPIKCVYLTTKVSSLNHKDELDVANLKDFSHDVKKFNMWFERKRRGIIRDEGGDAYQELIRHLFKPYLTATNKDFFGNVKKERGDWLLSLKPEDYSYKDVMTFGLSLCNNHLAMKDWNNEMNGGKDPTYVALLARMDQLSRTMESKTNTNNFEEGGFWKHANKEGKDIIVQNGKTFKWCLNICHVVLP